MAGAFCKTRIPGGITGTVGGLLSQQEKPPAFGYNYNSVLITETKILPGVAFPQAVTTPGPTPNGSIYTFPTNAAIVGLWLATSMTNPNADTVGVYVGKIGAAINPGAGQVANLNLHFANNIYFQHISISTQTISRTGGLSFGEFSGLLINAGEQFGCYLTGTDAAVQISYALSIIWIALT